MKVPITRRQFAASPALAAAAGATPAPPFPGIWRVTLGAPERITPVRMRRSQPASQGLAGLPPVSAPPLPLADVKGLRTSRGYTIALPLAPNELVYGLGLQFKSLMQRGLKKTLRVNSDPVADTGDSHAPVPFYVTTRGYGVLIDTARYAVFYCGNKPKKRNRAARAEVRNEAPPAGSVLPPAYGRFHVNEASEMIIEIPEAAGADVYLFAGPDMRTAVQRYNLFSGGGCLPPEWGLGFWYRCEGQFDQQQVLDMGSRLRASAVPCDVLGLEPGWQSHAYSCSFTWSAKFPQPADMLQKLSAQNYRVNLWEHAFTHPTSPIYQPLFPLSGDYEVWEGLVPDFLLPQARGIFSDFHEKTHVALGVAGYKLDECDSSDFTRNWSFPDLSRFPSGADGEQMHSLFGVHYQGAIQDIFDRRKTPTYGLVRSAQALAAPLPYVLYSDLYDHKDFIRALVNSGFSGLLWCPEVRDAKSAEDLIRRLQTVIFSPLAMINAWYIKDPPWTGMAGAEDACREIVRLRMRFIPYLRAAFERYHREGLPPFRALVMDYPQDARAATVDDQYMMGNAILVAPVVAGQNRRDVYLPQGEWYDFYTRAKHPGGQTIARNVPLTELPVFVKAGTSLPLAAPTLHTGDPARYALTVQEYGTVKALFEPVAPYFISGRETVI